MSWTWIVPVALFIALHTGTLLWFLASSSTHLRHLAEQVGELKIELINLRKADARVGVLEALIAELTRRIELVEKA